MASKTLTINIVGDAKRFKAASEQAQAETGKLAGFMQKHSTAIAGLGIAAAGAVVKSVSTFTNVGKEVSKLQRLTGGTAEEMSHLRFAAQQSAVPVDKLATALGILSKNIVAGKVEKLGIETKDAAGNTLPLSKVLGEVADKFEKMPNGPEKTAMAMQLFGRSGAALLQILNKGSAGLDELAAKADKLGVTLDQAQVDKMKKSVAATRDFQASLQGLQVSLGEAVIPALTSASTAAAGVASKFNALPEPVKETTIAVIAGAAAWSKFGSSLYSAETGLTNVGKAGVVTAAGIGSFTATTKGLNALVNMKKVKSDADGLAASLELLGSKGVMDGELPDAYGTKLGKLGDAIDKITRKKSLTDTLFPVSYARDFTAAQKSVDSVDKALAGMVASGHTDEAKAAIQGIRDVLAAQGLDRETITGQFDDYATAVYNAGIKGKAAAEAPGPSIKEQQGQWEALTGAIKTNQDTLASQLDAQLALPGARADVLNAQGAYNTALANARDGRGNQLADDQEVIRTREALGRAILREADLEAKALQKTGDAKKDDAAATHRQLDVLTDYTAKLDPNDPLKKNLNDYIWRLGVMTTQLDRAYKAQKRLNDFGPLSGASGNVSGGASASGEVRMPQAATQTATSPTTAPGAHGVGQTHGPRSGGVTINGPVHVHAKGEPVTKTLNDLHRDTRITSRGG